MKRFRKSISTLLVIIMILSISMTAFAGFKDTKTHWANKEISYFAEKEILNGYPDGTFKPENKVTKAEIYKIINKVMGYSQEAEINFSDVKQEHWFYSEVQKGVKEGYITSKSGSKLEPNTPATREEVATIIGIAFNLPKDKSDSAKEFTDQKKISDKAKGYISILKDGDYIAGYPDGSFKPDGSIKRSEVSKMVNNITGEIVNKASVVSKDIEGNILVNSDGVTLKDMVVNGNIYLSKGVGKGTLYLNNVKVKGQIINLSDQGKISKDETPVKSIKIISENNASKITKSQGSLQLSVKAEPKEATNKTVKWLVTETDGRPTDKAKIDGQGLLTGLQNGKVKVKATLISIPTISDEITIEISNQLSESTIVFADQGPIAKKFGDKAFTNMVIGGEGKGLITYTSENPKIATVNKTTGQVTIVAAGTTDIKAKKAATKTHGEVTNSYRLNVGDQGKTAITKVEIIGDRYIGTELKASLTPKEATVRYQWIRSTYRPSPKEEEIPGASKDKYIIRENDKGWKILLEVEGIGDYVGKVKSVETETILPNAVKTKIVSASALDPGQRLRESKLSGSFEDFANNDIPGKLEWEDSRTVVNETGEYSWKFTPKDLKNYYPMTGLVEVKVNITEFAGGSGTVEDPYKVSNAQQLRNIGNHGKKHFIQTGDIDLGVSPWNTGGGWEPIFSTVNRLDGSYDGKGYKISGLTINRSEDYQSLFGWTGTNGQIRNIGLENVKINGGYCASGLLGVNYGTIENCYVTGSITGDKYVGGLVGNNFANATITSTIKESYSTAKIKGNENVGGLVGSNSGIIDSSYAIGLVEGNKSVGGLVGLKTASASISRSFYDKDTTNQRDTGKGEGKTKEEMTIKKTFDEWDDFTKTWKIERSPDSYPYFKWQKDNISYPPADFTRGSGSEHDPYQISNAMELNYVRKYLDKHFIQTANINLSSGPWTTGQGWEPIGYDGNPFKGTYDGKAYTISGLYINRSENSQGLFGVANGSTLSNIRLVNVNVSGKDSVGSLAAYNNGTIDSCSATGNVYGSNNVGGLVGGEFGGAVRKSYSKVKVTGNDYVGGLIGYQHLGNVENNYATGSVTGNNYIGGLVGSLHLHSLDRSRIDNSYAIGLVSGNNYLGGIVGYKGKDARVNDCYYDKDTTGQSDSGKGNGRSTKDMISKSYAWDNKIWLQGSETYPYFVWQVYTDTYLEDVPRP